MNTGCQDWTTESLTKAYTDEIAGFKAVYPSQSAQAVRLKSGATYVAAFRAPRGQCAYVPDDLKNATVKAPLSAPAAGGRYRCGDGIPTQPSTANYLVDLAFVAD